MIFDRFSRRNFLRNPIDSSEYKEFRRKVKTTYQTKNPNLVSHFVISPYKKENDKAKNIANIKDFTHILVSQDFTHYKQVGFYMGDAEPSFLIKCPLREAIRFGNKYNQDAIIGLDYSPTTPAVSEKAVYIDLKSRTWKIQTIIAQKPHTPMTDVFFKHLEGSYIFNNGLYYIYDYPEGSFSL
jgi:hypothetical protein